MAQIKVLEVLVIVPEHQCRNHKLTRQVVYFQSLNRKLEKLYDYCNIKLEAALLEGLSGLQQSLPELDGETQHGLSCNCRLYAIPSVYACAA